MPEETFGESGGSLSMEIVKLKEENSRLRSENASSGVTINELRNQIKSLREEVEESKIPSEARIGFVPLAELKKLKSGELKALDEGLLRIRHEVCSLGDGGKLRLQPLLRSLLVDELRLNYDERFAKEPHKDGYTVFRDVGVSEAVRMEGLRRNRRAMVQHVPWPGHDFTHIAATETFTELARWRNIS